MPPALVPMAIAGGGIGGLALAVALTQRGFPVRVFERAPHLDPVGAGLNIWQNAAHVLRELGVLDGLAARGTRYRHLDLLRPDGRLLRRGAMPQGDPPGLFVRRADLQAALEDALPADVLVTGRAVAGFDDDGRGVTVRFDDGATFEASVLVGADGARSRVRAALLGHRDPALVYRGYVAWQGVVHGVPEGYGAGRLSETWGPGARFAMFPAGADALYWYATVSQPETAPEAPAGRRAELAAHFGTWHAPIPDVIGRIDEAAVYRTPIHDLPRLPVWTRGRVALLGDAAHAMTPNVGQGACQALEDALVLARRLAEAPDVPAAFRAYARARRARTAFVQREARFMGWVGQWRHPHALRVRDTLLRTLPQAITERTVRRLAAYRA